MLFRCRTCDESGINLQPLSEWLQHLLLEVTKINANDFNGEMQMPNQLCDSCTTKLNNAYNFIVQAQNVNKRLLEQMQTKQAKIKYTDCLLEVPIDIPTSTQLNEYLQIKMEVETCGERNISHETGDGKIEYKNLRSKQEAGDTRTVEIKLDPITIEEEITELVLPLRKGEDETESDDDYEPSQLNRGAGRHVCDVCSKTFAWKKDLQRHAKNHFSAPKHQCNYCERQFLRKDKLNDHMKNHLKHMDNLCKRPNSSWNFAERLYTAQRFRKIQCKLCLDNFKTIPALRKHILLHTVPQDLNLQLSSDVIKEVYSQKCNLDEVKASICADIRQQDVSKFFAVVNAYGYEMALSDSDDDANDGAFHPPNKYTCELCNNTFRRKFQVIAHSRHMHSSDNLPFHCSVCKIDFVSGPMYRLHTKSQCRSKVKQYQCLNCPGRFMWLENLDGHQCIEYKSLLSPKRKVLHCDVCDKTFVGIKELKPHMKTHESKHTKCTLRSQRVDNLPQNILQSHRRHIPWLQCRLCEQVCKNMAQLRIHLTKHEDGMSGVDRVSGHFYKVYYPQGCLGRETQIANEIAEDFRNQNTSRFYSAIDVNGNERDINDSETDTDIDSSNALPLSYQCEICTKSFYRRKSLLLHQNSEHNNLEMLPYPCTHCKRQFVCYALLQQHLIRDCLNIYKTLVCAKCSTRFVWAENLELHTQLTHIDTNQLNKGQLTNKLQCNQCDKTFIWPKDLTRHKRIHLPDDEKYGCPVCERKFNRKDNMMSHLKIHGEATSTANSKKAPNHNKASKVKGIDDNLCKPHGCKHIKCMICLSKHSKISDLRTHLKTHSMISFSHRAETLGEISIMLYPEEPPMTSSTLIARITADLQTEQMAHFYSITNEYGYELSLNSSETESDSESEIEIVNIAEMRMGHKYTCDLCNVSFKRKYKLFKHHSDCHDWLDAPHVCTTCNARFVNKLLLELHEKEQCKNMQKRFVCRKCPYRFMWKNNLTNHMRSMHMDDPKKSRLPIRYECVQCNRTFRMQKDLTRHMVMHRSDIMALKCMWCPRKFYRQENLHMHIKRHDITLENLDAAECFIRATSGPHGMKEIICKMCDGLQFQSIAALRIHFMLSGSHHDIKSLHNYSITNELGFELDIDDSETETEDTTLKPYTCEICSISCGRKYAMALHQRSVHKHEQLTLKCEKCIFRTVSTNILAHHKRTQCNNAEKIFQCTICSLKFMWQDNMVTHMRKLHATQQAEIDASPLSNPDAKNTNEKITTSTQMDADKLFHCDKCNCKYNRKDRLNGHIKKMHSQKTLKTINHSDVTERNRKAEGEKKFLCAFCGRAVTSSSNLIIHMRRHTGEKPFKCDFCDMAFPRSSDMQSHRRTHTGEKPHKCTVCNKAFSRSYKLQTHMRIHSGERPYKCTHCDKSFTQSNDCTLHIRRHTGEKPYACGTCGERFIQGTALKNHRTMRGHYSDMEPPKRLTLLEQF